MKRIIELSKLIILAVFQMQFYLYVLSALIISLFNPGFHESSWIINIESLMILQLIFIQAGIFLGLFRQTKMFSVWFYFLFVFSIFVLAISNDFYIFLGFALQSLSLYFRPSTQEDLKQTFLRAGVHAILFFLSAAIILGLKPALPHFGLNHEFLTKLIEDYGIAKNTLQLMYWGLLYFFATGLFELSLVFNHKEG